MKTSGTILFVILLTNLTLVHGGFFWSNGDAYKKVLERLEICIQLSSPEVLPFEFKVDVIENLNKLPSKYKDIYIEHDKSFGDNLEIAPSIALIDTIDTIFQEYRKKTIDTHLEFLEIIEMEDPIGFILYSTEKFEGCSAKDFASAIHQFHLLTIYRRILISSKTDITFIEPLYTHLDEELHGIPDEVLAEVATEGAYLLDTSINYFVDIANEHFNASKMHYEFNYQIIENYKPYNSTEIDDIQILYGGTVKIGAVGHWICTYYKASTQELYVYDSLHLGYLNSVQHTIIKRLYPNRKGVINYVRPKQTQMDGTSCGLFAIFYATSLLLGQNPQHIDVKMNHIYGDSSLFMRLHVLKIFANRKLLLFN